MQIEVTKFSDSTLGRVAKCDQQAGLSATGYHGNGSVVNAPAFAGKCAHIALECWLKGLTSLDCLNSFEAEYRAFSEDNVPSEDRLSWFNLSRIMEIFFNKHPLASMPFDVIATELALDNIHFANGIYPDGTPWREDMVMILDGIVRHKENKAIYALEHKTTGRLANARNNWVKSFRIDSQITAQVWGARELGFPAIGVIINGIGFNKLPMAGTRKCVTHGIPQNQCWEGHADFELFFTQRSLAEIATWKASCAPLVKRYKEIIKSDPAKLILLDQQGMFNDSCTFCSYIDFCLSGRRAVTLLGDREIGMGDRKVKSGITYEEVSETLTVAVPIINSIVQPKTLDNE